MEDKKKIAIGVGIAGAIAGVIYLLTRAKAPPPPPPGTANLYGNVTDIETGEPIPDVLVMLNGGITYTDGAGVYAFTDIAPGEYVIEFSKEGYETVVY